MEQNASLDNLSIANISSTLSLYSGTVGSYPGLLLHNIANVCLRLH